MALLSADDINESQQRQAQLDRLQRGTQVEKALYTSGVNTVEFDLTRIQGIQDKTRAELERVLGGQTGVDAFKARVQAMSTQERTEALHEFMDDAVMDQKVIEAFLEEDDDIREEMTKALEKDLEAPIDFSERPDAVIFMRTLIFSVDVDENPAATYTDRLKEKRLALIRQVANIPDDKGAKKLRIEKDELDRRSKNAKDAAKFFSAEAIGEFEFDQQKQSKGPNGVLDCYKQVEELVKMRPETAIEQDIAKAEAKVEGIKAQIQAETKSEEESKAKAKKTPKKKVKSKADRIKTLTDQLAKENGELSKFKSEKSKREEAEKAVKDRPKREATQREHLLKMCDKLEDLQKQLEGLSGNFDLPGPGSVNIAGPPAKSVNHPDFAAFKRQLSMNRIPSETKSKVNDNDLLYLNYYEQVLKPWLEHPIAENGETKSREQWLNDKLTAKADDIEHDAEKVKAKLDSLKSKREKKKSDEDFNIGLHYALAREDARFDGISRKALEHDIRINLAADVTDLEEKGRVGKSFNRVKSSIYNSINDDQRNRFYHLMNAKWFLKGKKVEIFEDVTVDINNPGQINKDLIDRKLTFAQGIRVYAALVMIGQQDHEDAQLIRRTLYERLMEKEGRKEAMKFPDYVRQAINEFEHYESDTKTGGLAYGFINSRAKRNKALARVHKARAGKMTVSERLAAAAKEKGGLTAGGIASGIVIHGFHKATPHVLGTGRDISKYAGKNLGSFAGAALVGTAKPTWNVLKAAPGQLKEGAKYVWQNKTLNPFKIVGGTVRAGVKGIGIGIKAPFKWAKSIGSEYKYKAYEKGADLKETAAKMAEKEQAAAANYTDMESDYHFVKKREFEWENFAWDDSEAGKVVEFDEEREKAKEKKAA